MSPKLTKTIIGAVIAVALAAAVSYGLISQQTADQIQSQANQTLQYDQPPNGSAQQSQPQLPTPPQNSVSQAPAQPGSSPQPPAPASR